MNDAQAFALRLARETARRFGHEALRPLALARPRAPSLGARVLRAHAELGLGLAALPEAAGGLGLGPVSACLIAESLAAGDVNGAFALPQPGAFADVVATLGNRHQRKIWLHAFFDDPEQSQGAVVVGPPGAIRARQGEGALIVRGSVPAAWHAREADRWVVVADVFAADGTPTGSRRAMVLSRAQDGVQTAEPEAHAGLPLSRTAAVTLADVRVPDNQCLGEGDATAGLRTAFTLQALRMGSLALGAARAASAYLVDLAARRRAAGTPLAHFHTMGFLLVDMHLACEAAFDRLRTLAEAGPLDEHDVAAARAAADEVAFFVTESALQMLLDAGEAAGQHPLSAWHEDIRLLARCYRADAYFAPGLQSAAPAEGVGFLC